MGAAEVVPLVTAGVVYLGIAVTSLAGLWMVFTKAGRPGWYALVPILNTYTLIRIGGRPGWWIWLTFVPCVGVVVMVIVLLDVADSFGRGPAFGVGLALLSPIFVPILGFGSSEYLSGDPYDVRLARQGPLRTPPVATWGSGPSIATGAPALPSFGGAATAASSVPAGWYPDPAGGTAQRWWDGTDWTEHLTP